jgi:hypothetical protein
MRLARAAPPDDDTVVLPRGRRRAGAGWARVAVLAGAVLALGAGVAAWRLLPGPAQQETVAAEGVPALPLATEAELAAETPETLTLHRFAANPRILVFDFPTLKQQGQMFDRIAVFAEKAGMPHDRVVTDAELSAAVRQAGETVETYYYGHDYSSDTLARFFRTAEAERIGLNGEEQKLRAIAEPQGLLADHAGQAVITVPRLNADALVDQGFRNTILHHELSHGEYFTNAAYAAYAGTFYHDVMDARERGAFARFLGSQGYDIGLQDLMVNETQAYLMFTPDPRGFSAAAVGLDDAEIAHLRARFRADMPAGWLRDAAAF